MFTIMYETVKTMISHLYSESEELDEFTRLESKRTLTVNEVSIYSHQTFY